MVNSFLTLRFVISRPSAFGRCHVTPFIVIIVTVINCCHLCCLRRSFTAFVARLIVFTNCLSVNVFISSK